MKSIVFFFLTFIYVAHSVSIRSVALGEWELFKLKHDKNYETKVEDEMRFMHFLENKEKIALHNAKYENGETTYFLEMNEFGDMTSWEFSERMCGFNKTARNNNGEYHSITEDEDPEIEPLTFLEPANVELPNEVDWRKEGAVTEVKNQGVTCGSCWAFSATGSLEGQLFRTHGSLVSLSEQNLIDCSRGFGNNGCRGGVTNYAFNYVMINRGIDTESSYPYEARDNICHYDPRNSGANEVSYVKISEGDENGLQAAVATVGPISVTIDATNLQFYKGGVTYDPSCWRNNLNHAVLAVGYGTDTRTGMPYWLVKNSWGRNWGEEGYTRIPRNQNNCRGIATAASYPIVK